MQGCDLYNRTVSENEAPAVKQEGGQCLAMRVMGLQMLEMKTNNAEDELTETVGCSCLRVRIHLEIEPIRVIASIQCRTCLLRNSSILSREASFISACKWSDQRRQAYRSSSGVAFSILSGPTSPSTVWFTKITDILFKRLRHGGQTKFQQVFVVQGLFHIFLMIVDL